VAKSGMKLLKIRYDEVMFVGQEMTDLSALPAVVPNPWRSLFGQKWPFILVDQLDELQDRRRELTVQARSVINDLRSVNVLASQLNTLPVSASALRSGWAQAQNNQPTLWATSQHSSEAIQEFVSVQDDLCAYVVSVARLNRERLEGTLAQYRWQLRRISDLIAIIQRARLSLVSVFCSVQWEQRRWFLFHGSRPPRQPVQAIMGLFAGACSRSLLAN
jgi:hypothetical protein